MLPCQKETDTGMEGLLFFFWMLCLDVLLYWGGHHLAPMKDVNLRAKPRLKTVEQGDRENLPP